MANSANAIVERALEELEIGDKVVQSVLGVKGKAIQIFWGALRTLDDSLAIPNFKKVGEKITEHYPAVFTQIKKAGLIEKGGKLGQWSVTKEAVDRLRALMENDGKPSAANPAAGNTDSLATGKPKRGRPRKTAEKEAKPKRKKTRKSKGSARKTKRQIKKLRPFGERMISRMTIKDILARIAQKQSQIREEAEAEVAALEEKKKALLSLFEE